MARTMQPREIQPNQLTEPHCVLKLAPIVVDAADAVDV